MIGVGDRRRRGRSHLLVGELEPLFDGFDIIGGVVDRGSGMGVQVDIWRKRWLATGGYHRN